MTAECKSMNVRTGPHTVLVGAIKPYSNQGSQTTPLDYSYTSERDVSIFTPVTGWCPNLKTAEMYVVTTHKPRQRA